MRSCLVLGEEGWRPSHALHHRRYLHTSWPRQGGVTLLGGGGAEDADTAEVAGEDGGVEETFGLEEPSRWPPDYAWFDLLFTHSVCIVTRARWRTRTRTR